MFRSETSGSLATAPGVLVDKKAGKLPENRDFEVNNVLILHVLSSAFGTAFAIMGGRHFHSRGGSLDGKKGFGGR